MPTDGATIGVGYCTDFDCHEIHLVITDEEGRELLTFGLGIDRADLLITQLQAISVFLRKRRDKTPLNS